MIVTTEFIAENPDIVEPGNAMDFISDDGGNTYNRCHCQFILHCVLSFSELTHAFRPVWSNFEIGDLDFWRGEAYMKFFEFLDSKGGFYYEVWVFFVFPAVLCYAYPDL